MISTQLSHRDTVECVELLSSSIAIAWLGEALGLDREELSRTLTSKAFARYEQMSDVERAQLVESFRSRRERAILKIKSAGQQPPEEEAKFPI